MVRLITVTLTRYVHTLQCVSVTLQAWIEFVPVKEVRQIQLRFPLPDLREHYASDVSTPGPFLNAFIYIVALLGLH